ncbi:MAG TPA: hypothetical protein VNJ02_09990 [Vicinamibacterales bacterium]|nr:hypothetical protein [Vicinamibacterales bacterium]
MYRLIQLTVCAAIVLLVAACGKEETPTSPTPATPTTITEVFSGTINRNGAATHAFSSQASGNLTATLTTLSPDSTLVVGLSIGTLNLTGVCSIVLAKDNATQSTAVNGGVSSLATLCVRIYDVGNITEPVSYVITVVHP